MIRVAATLLLLTVNCLNATSAETILCSNLLYLIDQSKTQFLAIRGGPGSRDGEYDSTFVLLEASHCSIFEDAEKASYKCIWKYPHGDQRAHKAYQRFVKEMRSCIGNIAQERIDNPVNHPDFYASYHFKLPDGEANVALKNKSKLMRTLVFVGVDGSRRTK